ncbi:hypothetical protein ANCDUO_06743, partial [Ancylostoma duodenale]
MLLGMHQTSSSDDILLKTNAASVFSFVNYQQFQDRLSYIDKRYDHLRKLTQTLKKKINDLE